MRHLLGFDKLHWFSAANESPLPWFQDFDLVATCFTEVNLSNFSHFITSLQQAMLSLLWEELCKFKNIAFNPAFFHCWELGVENSTSPQFVSQGVHGCCLRETRFRFRNSLLYTMAHGENSKSENRRCFRPRDMGQPHRRMLCFWDFWERDDGQIDAISPGMYFAEYEDWPQVEQKAMEFVKGRVLDVGCGAGRHAIIFPEKRL